MSRRSSSNVSRRVTAVALAGVRYTFGLLGRRDELLAVAASDAGDANDADGPTNGGSLG
jgi:hypothetical protein